MKLVRKLKPLQPSLREKKRYIGFEIISENEISFSDFEKSFKENLANLIGFYGISNAGAFVVKERYKNNKGIIRVNNNYTTIVKASFVKLKKINDELLIVKSIKTSGMIDKALR